MITSIMPLQVSLDADGEALLAAYLRSGRYHSAEEVVVRALETLVEAEPPAAVQPNRTAAEAVAHIRAARKGVTLGGLRIKELIDAGRKY